MDRYTEIQNDFKALRRALQESKQIIKEVIEWSSGYKENVESIPYNMQDELMASSIETCKKQFGADFENFKTPMLYYPKILLVKDVLYGLSLYN